MTRLVLDRHTRVLAFWILLAIPGSAQSGQEQPTRGTINILLGDRNGMVLVTDSRTTSLDGKNHWDTSPKLFKLDDKTVCSYANFATDAGPLVTAPTLDAFRPENGPAVQPTGKNRYSVLPVDSAAIIESFARELQRQGKELRFNEKVDGLAATLGLSLNQLANELNASSSRFRADLEIQLLFAGFDADGQEHMAKRIVRVKREYSGMNPLPFHIDIERTRDVIVEDRLSYLTAGYPKSVTAVEQRLEHPEYFALEPELAELVPNPLAHNGTSLNLAQIESLATALEKVAETTGDQVIGGEVQKAVLSNGKATYVPSIRLRAPEKLPDTIIIQGGTIKGGNFPVFGSLTPQARTVFMDFTCDHAWMFLDGSVLLGGRYESCHFIFNGRPFYLDPNDVEVTSSVLEVGFATDQALDAVFCLIPGITSWATLPRQAQAHEILVTPVLHPVVRHCDP